MLFSPAWRQGRITCFLFHPVSQLESSLIQVEGLTLGIVLLSSVACKARQAPPDGTAAQQKSELASTHLLPVDGVLIIS